jgi:hypothetical protein
MIPVCVQAVVVMWGPSVGRSVGIGCFVQNYFGDGSEYSWRSLFYSSVTAEESWLWEIHRHPLSRLEVGRSDRAGRNFRQRGAAAVADGVHFNVVVVGLGIEIAFAVVRAVPLNAL